MRLVAWLALGWMAAGCNGTDSGTDGDTECIGGASRTEDILCLEGDTTNGATVFHARCSVCHLEDGSGVYGTFPDIRGTAAADTIDAILNPAIGMTDFTSVLSNQEMADAAAHVETL